MRAVRYLAVPDPIDDLFQYAQKVAGRDRTWMESGSCRTNSDVPSEYWTVAENASVTLVDGDLRLQKVTGNEAQLAAERQCRECPVQWECARWAIEVEEEAGVWAMKARLLRWLQGRPNALAVIDTARAHREPVQVAVRREQKRVMKLARRQPKR